MTGVVHAIRENFRNVLLMKDLRAACRDDPELVKFIVLVVAVNTFGGGMIAVLILNALGWLQLPFGQ